jgi:hypothetical protein
LCGSEASPQNQAEAAHSRHATWLLELLFRVGSRIDPAKAGIAPRTIELMMLSKRSDATLALTELGRATLDVLL